MLIHIICIIYVICIIYNMQNTDKGPLASSHLPGTSLALPCLMPPAILSLALITNTSLVWKISPAPRPFPCGVPLLAACHGGQGISPQLPGKSSSSRESVSPPEPGRHLRWVKRTGLCPGPCSWISLWRKQVPGMEEGLSNASSWLDRLPQLPWVHSLLPVPCLCLSSLVLFPAGTLLPQSLME